MTSYFIYSKPKRTDSSCQKADQQSDQIIKLDTNSFANYILPLNNLSYHVQHGLFEAGLIEWCRQFCNKDTIMLDIGAHTGTYAISLAPYCKQVFAFEPQRMTYYALCGSVALSNLTNINCLNYGLGSIQQEGAQTLNIISIDGGGSSLHTTSPTTTNNQPIIGTEKIKIKMLDKIINKLLAQSPADKIGFIKMDIEDNELYALQGAQETIKAHNNPPILFESNSSNPELFEFLTNTLHYKIIKISGCHNMYLAN